MSMKCSSCGSSEARTKCYKWLQMTQIKSSAHSDRNIFIAGNFIFEASQSPSPRPRRGRRKQAMLANGALVKLRLA